MKYQVSLFYENIVRDIWEVEANSKDEAAEKAYKGEGEFQGDKTVSGECIFDATEIEEVRK